MQEELGEVELKKVLSLAH